MSAANKTEPVRDEITIERVFEAPRALVYAHWTQAEHLAAWFAPRTYEVAECTADARIGGAWRVVYDSEHGERYVEHGEFRELVAPERIVLTLVNENAKGEVQLRSEVQVRLEERDGRTTMLFRQTGLASSTMREGVFAGWRSCFDRLDDQLASQREVRALFEAWWRASETKDLDASMAPISRDVLAYEHEAPLVHRGVDALRATCKAGFDKVPGAVRWDVPDLEVIVRGDLAITWGLNHMVGPNVNMWSRGTRVFQKISGRWQMIHQHVSFPCDPTTGAAKMDLVPDEARP